MNKHNPVSVLTYESLAGARSAASDRPLTFSIIEVELPKQVSAILASAELAIGIDTQDALMIPTGSHSQTELQKPFLNTRSLSLFCPGLASTG
jgi:hypothetical protein